MSGCEKQDFVSVMVHVDIVMVLQFFNIMIVGSTGARVWIGKLWRFPHFMLLFTKMEFITATQL